jgi:hypothetical protein
VKLQRWSEAQPVLEETLASMLAFPKQSRWQMAAIYEDLAKVYQHTGQPDRSLEAQRAMDKWKPTSRPTTQPIP